MGRGGARERGGGGGGGGGGVGGNGQWQGMTKVWLYRLDTLRGKEPRRFEEEWRKGC